MAWLEAYGQDGRFIEGIPVCDRLTEKGAMDFMEKIQGVPVFFVARRSGNARIRVSPFSPILAREIGKRTPVSAFYDLLVGGADSFLDGMRGTFRILAPLGWNPCAGGMVPFIVRACGDIRPDFDCLAWHGKRLLGEILEWREHLSGLEISPEDFPARRMISGLIRRTDELLSHLAES